MHRNFSWSRVVGPTTCFGFRGAHRLETSSEWSLRQWAGISLLLRDGIVLCYTQDTRIHTRGQKLGFVGASNISKEKKGAAECSEQRTVLQRWRRSGSGTAWCGSRTRRSWSSAPTPRTRCCTRPCWWGTRIPPSLLGIERRRARKVAPTTVSEKVTSNKVSRMASWSFEYHIAGENVNNGKGRFP